jgi:hypothetical protein
VLPQPVALAPSPPKAQVDVVEEAVHRRPIGRPVVVPPPVYRRVALLRDFIKRRWCSAVEVPLSPATLILFKPSLLTVGRKLIISRRYLLSALLGRDVKPTNVNCTFG